MIKTATLFSLSLCQILGADVAGSPDPAFDPAQIQTPGPQYLFFKKDPVLGFLKSNKVFDPLDEFRKLKVKTGGMKNLKTWLVQPDGKILLGGKPGKKIYMSQDQGRDKITKWPEKERGLVRFKQDGTIDPGFFLGAIDPKADDFKRLETNGEISKLALQPDGKILVGGNFSFSGDGTANQYTFARLHPNGTLDTDFHAKMDKWKDQVDSPIRHFAQQADGKLVVTGEFRNISKTARASVARLLNDGSLDPSFTPPRARKQPDAVIILADGKILLQNRTRLIRLLNDPAFDELKLQRSGEIFWKRGEPLPRS